MHRGMLLAAAMTIAAPVAAADLPVAGRYRLVGEQDVASELVLTREGRYHYFLSAGALDERSEGRWTMNGGLVTLVTLPKPVPPSFAAAAPNRTGEAALALQVA